MVHERSNSMRGEMCSINALSVLDIVFFFFQAEDGIRDLTVTGVQTCALPIYRQRGQVHAAGRAHHGGGVAARRRGRVRRDRHGGGDRGGEHPARVRPLLAGGRSEERRVGKEGRSRWSPDHLKKKKRRKACRVW